jgi:hypothetical protein
VQFIARDWQVAHALTRRVIHRVGDCCQNAHAAAAMIGLPGQSTQPPSWPT